MNRAHQGRVAIRTFQVMAHALLIRGCYRMGGISGQAHDLRKEDFDDKPHRIYRNQYACSSLWNLIK